MWQWRERHYKKYNKRTKSPSSVTSSRPGIQTGLLVKKGNTMPISNFNLQLLHCIGMDISEIYYEYGHKQITEQSVVNSLLEQADRLKRLAKVIKRDIDKPGVEAGRWDRMNPTKDIVY